MASHSPLGLSQVDQPEHVSTGANNKLMPSRRQRKQQQQQQSTSEPLWKDSPQKNAPLRKDTEDSPKQSSLASIIGALDKNVLEKLKNKGENETADTDTTTTNIAAELIDPRQSILANPPLELRTVLRALRIDRNDLKTLLDIPLAIMSNQNVISLVELRNDGATAHMGKSDPSKLINLLKKYLTPPDEPESRY